MPLTFGRAPGKIILFGEHAVVYGQPAIAMPVTKVNATARVVPDFEGTRGQIRIQSPDVGLDADLKNLPENHPLSKAIALTLAAISPTHTPALTLQISSTIPVSAGMGSSAAISVAIIRSLSNFLGQPLSASEISDLAYEVEKIHHGTPSGIDNNVIAHNKPVYFMRDKPIEFLKIKSPTHWVVADTGEKKSTLEMVSSVRALHAADENRTGKIFRKIGEIVRQARITLEDADLETLGELMNENQRLLEKLNVSSSGLNHLIETARTAGAAGAKLSGGGGGGNLIALAAPEIIETVDKALTDAGAKRTITTQLSSSEMP